MRKLSSPGEGWARVRPEWVALAVTMDDAHGRPNIITLGWTMHASGRPSMAAIAAMEGLPEA